MWYLIPGKSFSDGSDGVIEIYSDIEVVRGVLEAAKLGPIHLFFNCVKEKAGDNLTVGGIQGRAFDEEEEAGDHSIGVGGLIHLLDDSDRTTDPEFYEALENLGLMGMRRNYKVAHLEGGEEVEMLYGRIPPPEPVTPEVAADNIQDDDGVGSDDENVPPDVEDSYSHSGSDGDLDEGDQNDGVPDNAEGEKSISIPSSTYRDSSDSDHTRGASGDNEVLTGYDRLPWYDPNCDHKQLDLRKGLKFKSAQQFREAVNEFAIVNGSDVIWTRSTNKKKEAVCRLGCGWRVYGSWYGRNRCFVLKTWGKPHSCPRSMKMRCLSARWIAKKYIDKFKRNLMTDLDELQEEINQTYGIRPSHRLCYMAKQHATEMLQGTLHESYGKLRSYIAELKRADPSGKFVMEVDPVVGVEYVLFRRFFVGFSGLIKGFLSGCRPMFGLDGCFLKGQVKGMLLSAVGKDGNNQMYPICWAVVESENRDSWNWFLELVQEQLGMADGTCWSIISDQQKVYISRCALIIFVTYVLCELLIDCF
ncbi:hypothetical protein LINGRAHAP2_LOCUS10628 [Linum grandiflorum]